jgi:hypothetical protein
MFLIDNIYNIYNIFNDTDFRNICFYLFILIFIISFYTQPTFGYDPLSLKDGIKFLNMNDIYFLLGYIILYVLVYLYIMNKKINQKIDTYRKMNEKYNNYSSYDFFKNNASDVLNIVAKETGYIIGPVIGIFLIIIVVFLAVNNVSKIVKPIVILTSLIYFNISFVIALINLILFINFYTLLY